MERKHYSFFTLIFLLIPSVSLAKVPLSKAKPVQIPVYLEEKKITSQDVQKIIPLDLEPTDNANYVANKVGDRAFQLWMKSPAIQNSTLGRTANQVEQSMKAEMSLAGTGEGSSKVEHKIGFSVLALQAVTRMTYKGWVNAEVNHDLRAKSTQFQITEKIGGNKDLTISHVADSNEGLSSLGVRWSF